MHTEESDSVVWCTPQSFLRNLVQLTLRCDAHCGAWLCSGKHTAELDSTVGCTPRSLTPRYDAHRGVWLRGVMASIHKIKKCQKILWHCPFKVRSGTNGYFNSGIIVWSTCVNCEKRIFLEKQKNIMNVLFGGQGFILALKQPKNWLSCPKWHQIKSMQLMWLKFGAPDFS